MDLRQLESLVSIAENGSLSRAALSLNLSQPSLSRQMSLLEAAAGQRLLVRTGRGVSLTPGGEALVVHARAMLEIARRAREELRDLEVNPGGRVTVGMPPRVAMRLSVPLIRGFRERFPRAVITVQEGLSLALREQLAAGRLDMALLFDPMPSPQLSVEPLMRERLLLVAPPGSRLPPKVTLPSLADYPLVLPNAPNAIRGLLEQTLGPRGITLTVRAEVGAVQTVLALVAEGEGCTILPESAVALAPNSDRLPAAPIGPPTVWNRLVLATPIARAGTRLTRETAQVVRGLDFKAGLPALVRLNRAR